MAHHGTWSRSSSARYRVSSTAAIVGDVSRQEDEAYRTGKYAVDLIHNIRQIEMVLLARLGHVKIAEMDPADDAGSIRRLGLKRALQGKRVHAGNSCVSIGEEGSLSGSWRSGRVSGIAIHNKTNASAAIAPKDKNDMR